MDRDGGQERENGWLDEYTGVGRCGLRRIDWVRVVVDQRGASVVRAEAVGAGYRLPRVVPISLLVATDLIRRGTPVVVRRRVQAA